MFSFPPLSSPQGMLLFVLIIWSLAWKGVALWKSARNNQLGWFLAVLLINLVGALEIIYIAFFQKKVPENK
ncbi:MAG: hypothetical protein KKB81_06840 [Candidatus Margulisbacteria bacterium]|nr:hypothetical protein [Candidatus Margulisiibacteriota bacterium]MBU1022514.1 hypothetical protein [Candidatus Margulisiibacteriota bacterium]MBU1728498.1 hypothetical protein [Candidatus Margulisiibacteriota bacterium]MBU1954645.1 hypothetical protein [Candidatus Margulisiibacteriota bacterium]